MKKLLFNNQTLEMLLKLNLWKTGSKLLDLEILQ